MISSKINKKTTVYDFAVALVSPLLMLIYSFKNYHIKKSFFFVVLSFALIGSTIVVGGLDGKADSIRYIENLNDFYLGYKTFSEEIQQVGQTETDVYKILITAFVGSFTNNEIIFFFIISFVFSFFLVKNIFLLFDNLYWSKNKFLIILLISYLILINPIWNVNGFRFWTAFNIFIYGSITYFQKSKIRGILILLLCLFVHFSFIIMLPLVFLSFLKNRNKILVILYLISFFVSSLDLNFLENYTGYLPLILQDRFETYTNEMYIDLLEENSQSKSLYLIVSSNLNNLFFGLIPLFFLNRKKYNYLPELFKNVFVLGLLIGIICNLLGFLPSFSRFNSVSNFFLLFVFIFSLDKFIIRNYFLKKLIIPIVAFLLLVRIRYGMDFLSFFGIFTNPFVVEFVDYNEPIINLIK